MELDLNPHRLYIRERTEVEVFRMTGAIESFPDPQRGHS